MSATGQPGEVSHGRTGRAPGSGTIRLAVALGMLSFVAAAGAAMLAAPTNSAPALGASTLSVAGSSLVDATSGQASPPVSTADAFGVQVDFTGASAVPADPVHIMPGDVVATPPDRPVVVATTGTGTSSVTLAESSVSSGPCARCAPPVGQSTDLGRQLSLTVTDVTNPAAPLFLYRGPLIPPDRPLQVRLPGGAAGSWVGGERHAYSLTVALPIEVGNDYQGTTASISFAWQHTAVLGELETRPGPLAFTGAGVAILALAAGATIAGGLSLVVLSRNVGRRRESTPPEANIP